MRYENIRTYIQTGNVVLSSQDIPDVKIIADQVSKQFKFRPAILLLTPGKLEKAVKNNPHSTQEGKSVHFFFCESDPKPSLEKCNHLKSNSEQFEIISKVFYLYAPDGIGRSKLPTNVEKCLGVSVTARNLNTVNKIYEMIQN